MADPDHFVVGIDHVQLTMPAGGEDAARAFYGGLLGLREVPKPGPLAGRGGCWFVGTSSGPAGDGPSFSLHLGVEADSRPSRKAHVALLVENLDGLRATLDAAGATTVDDDAPIDVRRFYAFDPFGSRLELVDARDAGFSERVRGS
ncbi:MAG TPA: VOC family protein [Candidatus Limnocylindria bacterium]|nr:VOC family protein [Candidatus Limnocylindria bacterium]